ncbi:ABC transporter ATP-binding protein [Acuticoccus mangrovi]|uniref:ABC transporter ATP-binding protein n=1 Tax=Acuticoccus mangrovi TaxID=2796142 RepID=UPI001B3BA3A9|nr:ABC transporter ATP-binding protein [Acuticoccus mangrovi]
MSTPSNAGLSIRDLTISFPGPSGRLAVVNRISLAVEPREILGLVGESGSGKSLTATAVLRLIDPPGAIEDGAIMLDGRDIVGLDERAIRALRGGEVAMIWQDPMASLNPVRRIGDQIGEAVRLHWRRIGQGRCTKAKVRAMVLKSLETVNIPEASSRIDAYPHQLSGGLQQRVMIAMALVCRPTLLIADEPTTALDVTIQAQILELVRSLRDESGMSVLLITHDLGTVAETADRAAVMYAGEIVEVAPSAELFKNPAHPYTFGLIASTPRRSTARGTLRPIFGSVPEPGVVPQGCRFNTRCPKVMDVCRTVSPHVSAVAPGHTVRCHLHG